MGRRSRKRRAAERTAAPSAVAERPRPATPPRPRSRGNPTHAARHLDDGPPKPPWHPFPLAELCIFASLILVIVGFIVWGSTGQILVGAGAVLGALATLEFTIREHMGGFRSHSTLLAGFLAIAAGIVAFFVRAPQFVVLGVAVVIFAAAFAGLRELFKRASGGVGWRGGLR
jgi:hypothetical protein